MPAVYAFLKVDDCPGDSQDHGHKDEIHLESWSWGETQSGQVGAPGSQSRVQMQDFHFTMRVNKASPKLLLACATAQKIPKAVLSCCMHLKGTREFLKYTLSDVFVSSYQTGMTGHSGLPIDQVSLSYGKIEVEYKGLGADGTLGAAAKVGYDLKANKRA